MTPGDAADAPVLHLADVGSRRSGEIAELDHDEARHVRALRLAPGDRIRVTDARGALRAGELVGDDSVRLGEELEAPRPLEIELWVGIGNKQATLWLVEKATEFGLRRLCPVECERSASVADAGRSPGFWDKAGRRALAAVKQSGGAWSPELGEPKPLEARLAGIEGSTARRIVLDPAGAPLAERLAGWDGASPVVILVGPEGGLTVDEMAACETAGFLRAGLGPTILRFETAAVAVLAITAQAVAAATNRESERGDR